MTAKRKRTVPVWSDVKARLIAFDHAGLLGLVHDLYAASKDNQTFLHARFSLGSDVLKPYKVAIDRWLSPDVFKDQSPSIAKAKKAIADYTKAIGRPEGIAELRVYYCERAIEFCRDVGVCDEVYLVALVRMFASALKMAVSLAEPQRALILARLDKGRGLSHECGYGVGFELEDLFDSYVGGG